MIKQEKIIITIISAMLLIVIYSMIFSFSADDGDTSSAISTSVTKWLAQIYYSLFDSSKDNVEAILASTAKMEAVIRKLAHFTEYLAVGFLSFSIAIMWIKSIIKGALTVVIQVVVSAGFDELHQYFVPGRHASLKDVLIDTAGGIAGIMLVLFVARLKKRWEHKSKIYEHKKSC